MPAQHMNEKSIHFIQRNYEMISHKKLLIRYLSDDVRDHPSSKAGQPVILTHCILLASGKAARESAGTAETHGDGGQPVHDEESIE